MCSKIAMLDWSLGGLAVAGLLMVAWRGLCTLLACLEWNWPYSFQSPCSLGLGCIISSTKAFQPNSGFSRSQLALLAGNCGEAIKAWFLFWFPYCHQFWNFKSLLKSSSDSYILSQFTSRFFCSLVPVFSCSSWALYFTPFQ